MHRDSDINIECTFDKDWVDMDTQYLDITDTIQIHLLFLRIIIRNIHFFISTKSKQCKNNADLIKNAEPFFKTLIILCKCRYFTIYNPLFKLIVQKVAVGGWAVMFR